MVTSIDRVLLEKSNRFIRGAFTVSVPAVNSTRVCSAAFASEASDGSVGTTSTTVSVRSLATMRTLPATGSRVTEIGSGVAKVGMAVPLRGARMVFVLVGEAYWTQPV